MNKNPFFLVIDVEATCSEDGLVPKHQMEIIEIGAVMVRSRTLEPSGEFQAFIRPVRHPRLTRFCSELTGILQADVDAAELFPEVLKRLLGWGGQHGEFTFCSWGDYDRKQFLLDCEYHHVPYPFFDHINLKASFSQRRGLKKRLGMAEALRVAGLDLVGRHHRGIDDARNIARLLPLIFELA